MMRPQWMGILNLSPDSFSGDGGVGDALARAEALVNAGADVIDIGAESTRPGATPLTHDQEWARLAPVFAALAAAPWRQHVRLSLDSYRPETVRAALDHGIDIINDVSGLQSPDMLAILRESACDIVTMHALTIPADKAVVWPDSVDPVAEILAWKTHVTARALAAGIAPERLWFDPGIGFGKTPHQSLALVLRARELVESGGRWLYGHSRKSFLTLFDDAPAANRDPLTRAFSAVLAQAGVGMLRVHEVGG